MLDHAMSVYEMPCYHDMFDQWLTVQWLIMFDHEIPNDILTQSWANMFTIIMRALINHHYFVFSVIFASAVLGEICGERTSGCPRC